ncbi:hypothetical protein COMA2_20391 [Candidatus Nitrospira nitrificans]|uniref:Uncharacterized protein n=1 Tax=Candidatus Nitrospira nitrificans TaxID=1742973 RepID=A0A0S4LKP7_9BACT|nr:hypothetical protein COMA2_20391 [Candidatus Nitrospira nitrificans]
MDRASDFGSEGWGFKSLRAHHMHQPFTWLRLNACAFSNVDTIIDFSSRAEITHMPINQAASTVLLLKSAVASRTRTARRCVR